MACSFYVIISHFDKFRKEIDLIDDKILSLLKKRSKLALNIGNIKNKNSSNPNLFRPERQFKILTRLFLKKNNFFSVNDIFSFWREIFSHQTNLQGGIDFFILNILKKPEKKMSFEAFGYDISIKTYKSLTRTFADIKNKNNRLLILRYPGKMKRCSWWRNKGFKGFCLLFRKGSIPAEFDKPTATPVGREHGCQDCLLCTENREVLSP